MTTGGSLFSGIGGFDLALKRAGIVIAWNCEIDKSASSVLLRQFPDVQNLGDVKNVRRDTAKPVDLICGGFPCQDLSIAGKRAGLAGERSGLWFEFARVIEEFNPGWVVIENVPGLLSSNGGQDFVVILDQMVKFGYGVCWRVLDAQYFGLAQRRKRVFIVGSLGNGRAAEVLFERESGVWDTPPSRETRTGTSASIGIQPAHTGANGRGWQEELSHSLSGSPLAVEFGGNSTDQIDVDTSINAHPSRRMDFESETFIAWEMSHASEAIRKSGDVAPTLNQRMGTGGNQVPMYGLRRLTPTECERLQGFPDGWTDGQSDSARYRQLGNAVAVPVAEWIIRRILVAQ